MSPLRKLLKHPATYLALLGLVAGSVFADSFRPPERQLAARVYIVLVRGYQRLGSPLLAGVRSVPLPSDLLPLLDRNRATLRVCARAWP